MSQVNEKLAALTTHINQLKKDFNRTDNIDILAVTKYASIDQMNALIGAGITTLAENKIQTALEKQVHFSDKNIQWYFIGHLQSNKAALATKHFDCIQSVDSLKLLQRLDHACKNSDKHLDILLQVNVAKDPKKYGFSKADLYALKDEIFSYPNLHIKGIMVFGPHTTDNALIRACFKEAKDLFDDLKKTHASFTTLSMGMTQDYPIAIEMGSTQLRIGRYLIE